MRAFASCVRPSWSRPEAHDLGGAWQATIVGSTPPDAFTRAAQAAAVARDALGRIGDDAPMSNSWTDSARAWVDFAADVSWRAANAPPEYMRAQGAALIEQGKLAATTLQSLAQSAITNGATAVGTALGTLANATSEAFTDFWGIPPIVIPILVCGLLAGGGWLVLGTAGGKAMLGSALGGAWSMAGTGASWGARGVAAYATGGATEIARAAI